MKLWCCFPTNRSSQKAKSEEKISLLPKIFSTPRIHYSCSKKNNYNLTIIDDSQLNFSHITDLTGIGYGTNYTTNENKITQLKKTKTGNYPIFEIGARGTYYRPAEKLNTDSLTPEDLADLIEIREKRISQFILYSKNGNEAIFISGKESKSLNYNNISYYQEGHRCLADTNIDSIKKKMTAFINAKIKQTEEKVKVTEDNALQNP